MVARKEKITLYLASSTGKLLLKTFVEGYACNSSPNGVTIYLDPEQHLQLAEELHLSVSLRDEQQ
jgi:hypothetical protein